MANDKDDPKDPIGTGYELKGPLVGSGNIQDDDAPLARTAPTERAMTEEERSSKSKPKED